MGRKFIFDKQSVGMIDYFEGSLLNKSKKIVVLRDNSDVVQVLTRQQFNQFLEIARQHPKKSAMREHTEKTPELLRLVEQFGLEKGVYTSAWFDDRKEDADQFLALKKV
jgi:hypothetical protein